MYLLTKPEAAVDFPREDLSEHNAQILELMLANKEIVARGHVMAEKISWIHRVGHPAIKLSFQPLLVTPAAYKAFDHGIRAYESAEWLTQSVPEYCDELAVRRQAHNLISGFSEDELTGYLDMAHQNFTADMPRTANVIAESTRRFHPGAAQYAIYGAGLARQFELDSSRN